MSSDKTEAERKFWGSPELVDTLLPFLDVKSILCLAECHQLTLKTLQGTSVWKKLVKRTCPETVQIVRAHPLDHDYSLGVRERLAPERLQLVHLVGILKMVEDPKAHLKALLDLVCERFPPYQDGPRLQTDDIELLEGRRADTSSRSTEQLSHHHGKFRLHV